MLGATVEVSKAGLIKSVNVFFTEHHSKHNLYTAQHVYEERNIALSANGPFKSKSVHLQATAGSMNVMKTWE